MTRSLLGALCAIATWTTATGLAPVPLRLEICSGSRVVWSAPVAPGDTFDLRFIHSREHVPWTQHYHVAPAGIWQRGSTFPAYGAGMPIGPARPTPAGFLSTEVRALGEIKMMGHRDAAMTLLLRGRSIPLDRWFGDFEPFSIRLR